MNTKKSSASTLKTEFLEKVQEMRQDLNFNVSISGTTITVDYKKTRLRVSKQEDFQDAKLYSLKLNIEGEDYLSHEEKEQMFQYFLEIDKFWNTYEKLKGYQGHVYLYDIMNKLREDTASLIGKIKSYFEKQLERSQTREEKNTDELQVHEYNLLMGRAVRTKFQRYIGGHLGKVIRNRMNEFVNIYSVFTALFKAQPLLCLEEKDVMEHLIVKNTPITIHCGAEIVTIFFKTVDKKQIDFSTIVLRTPEEGEVKDTSIKLYNKDSHTTESEPLIHYFNNLLETNKLKNLVKNPHHHFNKLMSAVVMESRALIKKPETGIEYEFGKLVDALGSWEEAEKASITLSLQVPKQVKIIMDDEKNSIAINLVEYRYQDLFLYFICKRVGIDNYIELVIDKAGEESVLEKRIEENKKL